VTIAGRFPPAGSLLRALVTALALGLHCTLIRPKNITGRIQYLAIIHQYSLQKNRGPM